MEVYVYAEEEDFPAQTLLTLPFTFPFHILPNHATSTIHRFIIVTNRAIELTEPSQFQPR